MMTFVAMMTFGSAFGLAGYALASTILPQWRRIATVLGGGRAVVSRDPLSARERAERRSAVRRWSAESAPAMQQRSREAA